MTEPWDYIVVGAGSAGCVLANRLSERRELRVLVLEAGTRDWSPFLLVPAGRVRMNAKYDWDYPGEPDPTLNNRVTNWESGKVLGGSSSTNGMLWCRGDHDDFDGWAKLGCEGWEYESVLPYFKRAEHFEGGANFYRGSTGPLSVSFIRTHHPLVDVFVEAAKNTGFEFNPDNNAERQDGVSLTQVSQKRGLRHSAARAYLAPAARRPNVRVITKALVRRVILEGNRAVGVEYERNGMIQTAMAEREIVISAGAIGFPRLLLLSGIGPAEQLRKINNGISTDLPGVGQHLKNHQGMTMLYEVNVQTMNREFTPWRVLKHGCDLIVRGRGVATAPLGFADIRGSVGDGMDYKVAFGPYADFVQKKSVANSRDKHKLALSRVNAVKLSLALLHPKTEGSISLRSSDPNDPPVIHYEAMPRSEELAGYVAVCRKIREVMSRSPMRESVVRELVPGEDVQSPDDWEETIRSRISPVKHGSGTCKMGTDEMAVVDPSLRVRGVERLRVIDASIMPTITSGGTNAPTIMIAERGADFVLADAR